MAPWISVCFSGPEMHNRELLLSPAQMNRTAIKTMPHKWWICRPMLVILWRWLEDPLINLFYFSVFRVVLFSIHHLKLSLSLWVFLFLTTASQLAFINESLYLEVVAETGSGIYMGGNCMNRKFCLVHTNPSRCLRNVPANWRSTLSLWTRSVRGPTLQWGVYAVWEIETEWNPSLLPWLFVVISLQYSSPHKQMVASLPCQVYTVCVCARVTRVSNVCVCTWQ